MVGEDFQHQPSRELSRKPCFDRRQELTQAVNLPTDLNYEIIREFYSNALPVEGVRYPLTTYVRRKKFIHFCIFKLFSMVTSDSDNHAFVLSLKELTKIFEYFKSV